MTTEELTFETVAHEDVQIFSLTGKYTLYNTQPIKEAFDAALKAGARRIVFDLRGCDYMDSAGMGSLVGCKFKCTKEGGRFAICNVTPEVFATLRLARLDRVIDVAPALADALQRVRSSEPSELA